LGVLVCFFTPAIHDADKVNYTAGYAGFWTYHPEGTRLRQILDEFSSEFYMGTIPPIVRKM
jgi:hypothetical protein